MEKPSKYQVVKADDTRFPWHIFQGKGRVGRFESLETAKAVVEVLERPDADTR